MKLMVTSDEVRGATTRAAAVNAALDGCDDVRMSCQAKIIIAAKRQHITTVYSTMRALHTFQQTAMAQQAIGLSLGKLLL
jgi:hypothetical protein